MQGCFVTATDTGVGKTVVASAICCALRAAGRDVVASKPVVTGIAEPEPGVPADHELLAACTGQDPQDVCTVTFGPAVSPHLAAEQQGVTLDGPALVAQARGLAAPGTALVVEGVGGLLVPLGGGRSIRDHAVALGLPLVIAARPGLGTINHTLMTIECARSAGLRVAAVVMTPWPAEPSEMERSNAQAIESLAGVRVMFLPHAAALTPEAIAVAAQSLGDVSGLVGAAQPVTPSIDHVVIAVSDWERSNAFYRDVCLAELVRLDEPPPTRWRYRFGAQQLNVHGPGMMPLPVARIAAEPGMADLCLVWPGPIEEAVAHLAAAGASAGEGPVPRNGARGPGMSVYFSDPDGSLLEFISYG